MAILCLSWNETKRQSYFYPDMNEDRNLTLNVDSLFYQGGSLWGTRKMLPLLLTSTSFCHLQYYYFSLSSFLLSYSTAPSHVTGAYLQSKIPLLSSDIYRVSSFCHPLLWHASYIHVQIIQTHFVFSSVPKTLIYFFKF